MKNSLTQGFVVVLLALLASATFAACGEAETEPAGETANLVEVAQGGTHFDPAVPKDQIPEGAWMCDMGTVHYASLDEGEGTCPTCSMALKQR